MYEVCPVEVGITDGLCQRMGKDAEADPTEARSLLLLEVLKLMAIYRLATRISLMSCSVRGA